MQRRARMRVLAGLAWSFFASLVLSGYATAWLARSWGYDSALGGTALSVTERSFAFGCVAGSLSLAVWLFRTRRWESGAWSVMTSAAAGLCVLPVLYAPWSVYRWARLAKDTPDWILLESPFTMSVVGSVSCLLGSLVLATWKNQQAAKEDELGTSRYATERELRKAGMLVKDRTPADGEVAGIILGLPHKGGGVIRTPGAKPTNLIVYGPPRTGKGVGLVLPNLLDPAPVSRIVFDDKGEAWDQASQWLKEQGFIVLRFDPSQKSSSKTNSWNPLRELRTDPLYAPSDAFRVARMLADPDGQASRENPFFQRTGPALMQALILEALAGDSLALSLPALAKATSGVVEDSESLLMRLKECGAHDKVKESAASILAMEPQTRLNVEATVFSYLSIFGDPLLKQHLERSDFQLMDLVCADRPVALFVTMPEKTSPMAMPLLRIFMQMLIWTLSDRLREGEAKWRLRIIADEFASFGRMDEWRAALGRLPGVGKGVDSLLIVQSATDLEWHYKDAAVIADLCDYKVVLRSQGKTAEWISKAMGERMVSQERRSWKSGTLKEHGQVSSSDVKRALLTADEIRRLSIDEVLLVAAGQHPYKARLIEHWSMQPWASRTGERAGGSGGLGKVSRIAHSVETPGEPSEDFADEEPVYEEPANEDLTEETPTYEPSTDEAEQETV